MRQRHTVMWSETAEKDLLAIVQYIADDSPSRAYEVFKDIKRRAASLRSSPERSRVVPELQEHGIIQGFCPGRARENNNAVDTNITEKKPNEWAQEISCTA